MNGALIIDKPSGMSSFDVLRDLKRKIPQKKMGFLGTLDPLATGVLVVFLGKATGLIPYFSESRKAYEVSFELGKQSDTYDVTGKIEMVDKPLPTLSQLEAALKSFIGPIWQLQPAFSAIHVQGKRSYELAREGKAVDLGKRQVDIFELKLLVFDAPFGSLFVQCSSGTYVRSLVHELGQKLECGAVMTGLRRTSAGPFHLDRAVKLETVSEKDLIQNELIISEYIDWKGRSAYEKNVVLKKFTSTGQ